MEIEKLMEFADDTQPITSDEEASLLLSAKMGQLSQALLRKDSDTLQNEDAVQEAIGGVLMAVFHAAEYHDVDTEEAIGDVIDEVETRRQKSIDLEEAIECLDYKRIAELMGMVDEEEKPENYELTEESTTEAFY